MKSRTRLSATLLLPFVFLCFQRAEPQARAQTDETATWEKVAPINDQFSVLMPRQPVVKAEQKEHGAFSVEARIYTVAVKQREFYSVWSLANQAQAIRTGEGMDNYLDSCAELVWKELVKPKRNAAALEKPAPDGMAFVRQLKLTETFHGREYRVSLGRQRGLVQLYYSNPRVFVVMALEASPVESESLKQFFDSFTITAPLEQAPGDERWPLQTPSSASSPMVLTGSEVTQKARILAKSEPQYTEEARKFGVTGTIVLKAVLAATGEVTDIKAIRRLPHGLTRTAIEAARQIKFEPARKDGQSVSQYIQIEYNYHLY